MCFCVPSPPGASAPFTTTVQNDRLRSLGLQRERLGSRPRLRSKRGWVSDQRTTTATLPSPHSPTPNKFGFVMNSNFPFSILTDCPAPICLSFHLSRPEAEKKRRRPRTPGHETTAGTRKQEVTYLFDGVLRSLRPARGPGPIASTQNPSSPALAGSDTK